MVTVALFVRLGAKLGKEKEVEQFLRNGLPLVNEEPATMAWFGIRLGPRPSESLTRFLTRAEGKRIYREKSPPRS